MPTFESQLHPRGSKFYGWATSETPAEGAMQLRKEYVDALLALPKYADMDIVDLYRMAEEKLTYTKKSGVRSGEMVRGIQIASRAFAVAIIVGASKIDDPMLQMPDSIDLGDGNKISL